MTTKQEIERTIAEIRAEHKRRSDETYRNLVVEIDKQIEAERERRQNPFKGITRNTEQ